MAESTPPQNPGDQVRIDIPAAPPSHVSSSPSPPHSLSDSSEHIIVDTAASISSRSSRPSVLSSTPSGPPLVVSNLSYSAPDGTPLARLVRFWMGAEGAGDVEASYLHPQGLEPTPRAPPGVEPGMTGVIAGSAKEPGKVFQDISFSVQPGEVFAVAGCCGVAKSLIAQAIAGRIQRSSLSGKVSLGKAALGTESYRHRIGYVAHDGPLCGVLTVHETLALAANLRMPADHSQDDREGRVSSLLRDLGLKRVAERRVGEPGAPGALPQGQRVRLMLGVELVHDPRVMVLDEPMKGLLREETLDLAGIVRRQLADSDRRIVVMAVQQPCSKMLQNIDKVVLLSGPHQFFCGTLPLLQRRLEGVGRPVPPLTSALELAIELLHKQPQDTVESFKETEFHPPPTLSLEKLNKGGSAAVVEEQVAFATNPVTETLVLVGRQVKVAFRSVVFPLWAIHVALCGLLLGSIFLNLPRGMQGLQLTKAFLSYSLAFLLLSFIGALPLFYRERALLFQSVTTGTHRIITHQIASAIVALPFLLILTLLFSMGSYFLVGLSIVIPKYLLFLLIVWFALIAGACIANFVVALAPDFWSASMLFGGVIGAFNLFAGFFVPYQSIPAYWIWMFYISILKYPLGGLVINEYGNDSGPTNHPDASEVLASLDLTNTSLGMEIGAILVFASMYLALSYVTLMIRSGPKR